MNNTDSQFAKVAPRLCAVAAPQYRITFAHSNLQVITFHRKIHVFLQDRNGVSV